MHARILIAAAMTLVSLSAFAADGGSVGVPIGALATQVLPLLQTLVLSIVGAMLAWLMAKLGPEIAKTLHSAHVDQVIACAIDAGFGLVESAAKGKVLEIPVANKVIRKAAQYVADAAPELIEELGDNLGPMLVARLSALGALPPSSSAANLDLEPYVEVGNRAA
jgi:hypothetical protein